MGAEGSVTLQLREAVQASESGSTLDGLVGYPDHEMLADMLGTLQAAGAGVSSSSLMGSGGIGAGDINSFDLIANREIKANLVSSITKTTLSSVTTHDSGELFFSY